jgi:hypothetical protein
MGKRSREYQNTYFLFKNIFYENLAVNEVMWKNNVEPNRPQMKIRRMRVVCRSPKATNADSQYVTFISLPLHQRLHESVSVLLCMYCSACLVYISPSAGAFVAQSSVAVRNNVNCSKVKLKLK